MNRNALYFAICKNYTLLLKQNPLPQQFVFLHFANLLRPKHCVSRITRNTIPCVCKIHKNIQLLLTSTELKSSSKKGEAYLKMLVLFLYFSRKGVHSFHHIFKGASFSKKRLKTTVLVELTIFYHFISISFFQIRVLYL